MFTVGMPDLQLSQVGNWLVDMAAECRYGVAV
jgi:hypothetical protein